MAEDRTVEMMQRKRDPMARSIDALLFSASEHKSWYCQPRRIGSSEIFGGRTVHDFRGQRLFVSSIDWRVLLIWTVVIVAFCLLFRLGTHTLPSQIAAVILR